MTEPLDVAPPDETTWRPPAAAFLHQPPPIEACVGRFWECGPGFDDVTASLEGSRLAAPGPTVLERLGPSPFERGGFPVIGFLATTYEKVSRYAGERLGLTPPGV